LLGESKIGGCALRRSFALCDHLLACSNFGICELRICDRLRRFSLTKACEELWIGYFIENRAGGHFVATLHGPVADSAIDPRRNVDAGGVGFPLDEERLRLHQIPN